MSGKLRVPAKRAAQPRQGGEFPEGLWEMTLEEFKIKEIDPSANPKLQWMFTPNDKGNVRYKGPTASVIGIQLGQAAALEEGQDDAGARKVFVDLTIKDGETYIDEVGENAENVGYQISIDGALFTNLALALGAAYEQDGYVYPADDFRENLVAGTYKGIKVVAKIRHRKFNKRDGTRGMEVEVEYFSPAA